MWGAGTAQDMAGLKNGRSHWGGWLSEEASAGISSDGSGHDVTLRGDALMVASGAVCSAGGCEL